MVENHIDQSILDNQAEIEDCTIKDILNHTKDQTEYSKTIIKTSKEDLDSIVRNSIEYSKSKINIETPLWDGLIDTMKSSWPFSPLPTDLIDQIYSKEGPLEGTSANILLKKIKGFSYFTIFSQKSQPLTDGAIIVTST